MKRWIIDIADSIDIWATTRFNIRPKQKALEWHMDHIRDPYIENKLNEALGIESNERERKTNQRTD